MSEQSNLKRAYAEGALLGETLDKYGFLMAIGPRDNERISQCVSDIMPLLGLIIELQRQLFLN